MALQATHIKYALDLQDKYRIKNLDHYLSGVNYPDSRYLTRVDREKTHNLDSLKPLDSDFKKGWHNHLVCDLVQGEAMNILLPDEFHWSPDFGSRQMRSIWFLRTAIKIMQEIEIFKTFDIQPYLSNLSYAENPYGENLDILRQNNKLIKDIYQNKKTINVSDTLDMWRGLNLSEDLISQLDETVDRVMVRPEVVDKIDLLYSQMLQLSDEYYQDLKI